MHAARQRRGTKWMQDIAAGNQHNPKPSATTRGNQGTALPSHTGPATSDGAFTRYLPSIPDVAPATILATESDNGHRPRQSASAAQTRELRVTPPQRARGRGYLSLLWLVGLLSILAGIWKLSAMAVCPLPALQLSEMADLQRRVQAWWFGIRHHSPLWATLRADCDPTDGVNRAASEIELANVDVRQLLLSIIKNTTDITAISHKLSTRLSSTSRHLGHSFACGAAILQDFRQAEATHQAELDQHFSVITNVENSGRNERSAEQWAEYFRLQQRQKLWVATIRAADDVRDSIAEIGAKYQALAGRAAEMERKAVVEGGPAVLVLIRRLTDETVGTEISRQLENSMRKLAPFASLLDVVYPGTWSTKTVPDDRGGTQGEDTSYNNEKT